MGHVTLSLYLNYFDLYQAENQVFKPNSLLVLLHFGMVKSIFKIIDTQISFYSRSTHLLPPKPKSSFRHLKRGIQDFHMNYVLVPSDKAADNVVVV